MTNREDESKMEVTDALESAAKRMYEHWANYPKCSASKSWEVRAAELPGSAKYWRELAAIALSTPSQGERVAQDTTDLAGPVVPEGWKIVPKRLTADMMEAACKGLDSTASMNAAYELALEAAPAPQTTSTLSPHIEGENDGGGR